MVVRRWPAAITRAERVQLIVLLAVLAVGATIAFGESSQLITPPSLAWLVAVTAVGVALGVRLHQILVRVNRDYRAPGRDLLGRALILLLTGFLFYCMAWSLADRAYFRNGGTAASATFPLVRLTRERHDRAHWALIGPFGWSRGTMIPISFAQYRVLVQGCGGGDCSGAGLCITLPVEHAPGGATRVMTTEDSTPPDRRPIAGCR